VAIQDTLLILQVVTLAMVLALAYGLRRILIIERMILRVEQTLLNVEKKMAKKIIPKKSMKKKVVKKKTKKRKK